MTPFDDVALTVGTFGLWVPISLAMEAWDLYKDRSRKQEQAGAAAAPPAQPPRFP